MIFSINLSLTLTSICAFAVCALGAPQKATDGNKNSDNVIKNGCVCGRTLYEPEFAERRNVTLNACIEKLFGTQYSYRGPDPINVGCPEAAILALKNLRRYSAWKVSTLDDKRQKEYEACFYGQMGWMNADGSANPAGMLEEIARAKKMERDRGVESLRKAQKESNAAKKQHHMEEFEYSTYAYKLLSEMAKRAADATICDQSQISQHYRCTFRECFSSPGAQRLAV